MSEDTLLSTVEQRVRTLVDAGLRSINTRIGVYLGGAINADPTASGAQVTSDTRVHAALVDALAQARASVEGSIRAGYRAAVRAGLGAAAAEAGELGFDASDVETGAGTLEAILRDVGAAFAAARLDIVDSARVAIDGVDGPDQAAARVLVAAAAVDRATRRLGVRVKAAAAVAVHQGYTDGQAAVHDALAAAQPYLTLTKRWEVRSANPCPACAALHGTSVALDADFDATATVDATWTPPRPWRGTLGGPPRHPNCRCRIVLDLSPASGQLRAEIGTPGPARAGTLSAADIRRMDKARYTALTGYLDAALTRLQALLKEIRDGQ